MACESDPRLVILDGLLLDRESLSLGLTLALAGLGRIPAELAELKPISSCETIGHRMVRSMGLEGQP
jgi:hypothetical protein